MIPAQRYLERGFAAIPVPRGSKAPRIPGWQRLRLTLADLPQQFRAEDNIGLLLGTPSGGLVDVDLDCGEAVRLAPVFLRPTAMRHGRASKPNSHWFYRCDPPPRPAKFTAPDGGCLVELRSTGQQTIVPPSVHPSGEALAWESDGEPAGADANTLMTEVGRLAAAALLLRHYPAVGSRNEFCLALAGLLLRGGMPPEYAQFFIRELARAAEDEECEARAGAVPSTAGRLESSAPARAGRHLGKMLGADGERVVGSVRKWLGLAEAASVVPISKHRPPSAATVLLGVRDELELFHDGEGRGYACLPVDGHMENWPIRSREFSLYLRRQHFGNTGSALANEAVQTAIETFEADALFSGPKMTVRVRTAERDGRYFLDLADSDWRVVEISPAGWRVITDPPIKFLRPRGLMPFPMPVAGGLIADLRPFANVADDGDWVLASTWLLAALRPVGPYPVLALYGEHGSAKSTTARVLRALIDPNRSPLRAAPRDTHELMIQASSAHLLCLDNLSGVPQNLSDALCRLATGGGFSARELYTDDAEKLFDAQRPILLNGIEDLCTRPDLLDRSIAIMLPPIPDDRREPEEQFWERFEAARPRILGALFDCLARGVAALPRIRLSSLPRMADFARWGAAVETGMGVPAGAFLRAYEANRLGSDSLTLEASPVAVALGGLMAGRDQWQGTATDLLRNLNAAEGDDRRREKSWPANARALGSALRRVAPNFRAGGFDIVFFHDATRARNRIVRLRRMPEYSSAMSATSVQPENAAPSTDDTGASARGPNANKLSARDLFASGSDIADRVDAKKSGAAENEVAGERSQNPMKGSAGPQADDL